MWARKRSAPLIGASARFVGLEPVLGLHALLILTGVLPLTRLPPCRAAPRQGTSRRLDELVAGIREGARVRLRCFRPFLLVAVVGIGFIGPLLGRVPGE